MASTNIATELEIKLEPDLDFVLPDLRATVGRVVRLRPQRLCTRYFDTADFRLRQRGLTLRHRTGASRGPGTWTLKLPEGGESSTLDRCELSWAGRRDNVPVEVSALLLGVVRRSQLQAVADLDTTRRRVSLRDETGTSWAELDDDIVTVVDSTEGATQFRQLELELVPGGRGPVDEVLGQLRNAGARPDNEPKLAKAVAALPALDSDKLVPRLKGHVRIGDVARACIADGLNRLLDHDYRLRVAPSAPAVLDVHQARVATRRLRSDLKTFRPLLDPIWVDFVRGELKWVGETLGQLRNVDVLMDILATATSPREPGRQKLQRALAEQRAAAAQQLGDVLASGRYLDLLDRLRSAADLPPLCDEPSPLRLADHALPGLVGRQWRALHRRVRKAGDDPSDGQLHQIRIAAKQLRYAAEAAAPVIGNRQSGWQRPPRACKRCWATTMTPSAPQSGSSERPPARSGTGPRSSAGWFSGSGSVKENFERSGLPHGKRSPTKTHVSGCNDPLKAFRPR